MTTYSTAYRISHTQTSTMRSIGTRVLTAVKRWLAAIDRSLAASLERNRRNEHERFLSRASDASDLERLEREWERRRMDSWRVQ